MLEDALSVFVSIYCLLKYHVVLILIMLEDALSEIRISPKDLRSTVLILIMLEDALSVKIQDLMIGDWVS